jgi:hypothetical protein
MFRAIFPGVMWVGRATVFVVGLSVVLAVVLGVATAALAAVPGDPFRLGQVNSIDAVSRLVGSVTGPVLRIDNDGGGPALRLESNANRPPLVVNADAGKATYLSADELDNKDSSAFLPSEIYEKSVTQTLSAGSVDNGITLYCDPGDVAVSGSYRILQPGAYLKVFGEERVDDRFDEETGKTNPSGWHVYVDNPDATTGGSIKVFVYCADRPPLHVSPAP